MAIKVHFGVSKVYAYYTIFLAIFHVEYDSGEKNRKKSELIKSSGYVGHRLIRNPALETHFAEVTLF